MSASPPPPPPAQQQEDVASAAAAVGEGDGNDEPASADHPMAGGGGGSLVEDMAYQRDVSMDLARKLAQDLETKRTLLGGRLENALRLCAEAEVRLGKANREYQSKHLTVRKRMLTVVATLALASFIGWLVCAFITQRFPLGALLIFPVSLVVAIHLFGKLDGEEGRDGLLSLVWS